MSRRRAIGCIDLVASLVLLVGGASANYLTLSNFENLASLMLPLNCLFAYNTAIRGCYINDFWGSNACSPECKQGLQTVQINIVSSCAGVESMRGTLLWDAQQGRLVEALCPGDPRDTMTTATTTRFGGSSILPVPEMPWPPPSTATDSLAAFSSAATPTKARGPGSRTAELAPTEASNLSGSTDFPTTLATKAQAGLFLSSDLVTTSTAQQQLNNSSVPVTSSTLASQANTQSMTSPDLEPPRRTLQAGSGGGSPFDFVTSDACRRQAKPAFAGAAVVVASFIVSVSVFASV